MARNDCRICHSTRTSRIRINKLRPGKASMVLLLALLSARRSGLRGLYNPKSSRTRRGGDAWVHFPCRMEAARPAPAGENAGVGAGAGRTEIPPAPSDHLIASPVTRESTNEWQRI